MTLGPGTEGVWGLEMGTCNLPTSSHPLSEGQQASLACWALSSTSRPGWGDVRSCVSLGFWRAVVLVAATSQDAPPLEIST